MGFRAAACALVLIARVAHAGRGDAAWDLYDHAFERLGHGAEAEARAELQQLIDEWPEHPAARVAAARLSELDGALHARAVAAASGPNRLARGEFVFWSVAGSVYLAANLCIDRCTTVREGAVTYTLTSGGTLALSVLASRNIHSGEAQLYDSAQVWGAWNGIGIDNGFAEDQSEATTAIVSQVGGLGIGLGLWQLWHPTQGDVALANSGLLWGNVLATWGQLAFNGDANLGTSVVLGDVGLVLAGVASTQIKMSRGRTLLIDVGGMLGTLGGSLVAISTHSDQGAGTALLLGTSLGLVLGVVGTQSWDAPSVPARVVATRVGSGWGLALAFTN